MRGQLVTIQFYADALLNYKLVLFFRSEIEG